MLLKSDIINETFSLLRISGLTVEASPADKALCLARLESLASELETRQVRLNYNFKEAPDVNDAAGIDLAYKYSVACVLAFRIFPDFGKGENPDQVLSRLASGGASYLASATAIVTPVAEPTRQPSGSGNAPYTRCHTFYKNTPEAPNKAVTKLMYLNDVDNFTESFSDYLKSGESISSYTIEADPGLTPSAAAISASGEAINYTITATGGAETASNAYLRVKLVIKTSSSRIVTRIINFKITTVEI